MTTERWQQVKQILEYAWERDGSERTAFLDETCASDPDLRQVVEALLESDQKIGDFLAAPAIGRAIRIDDSPLLDVSEAFLPSVSIGTRLGPYEIVCAIASGGMGEVYRAYDTRLDRTVAIKVLPTCLSQYPHVLQQFDCEARAVSRLNHPNICTLHDMGHYDGINFLVMEYLEGETLADRLCKGPLSLHQAVHISKDIAGALDHAHRHGVVHRDLKPGNIMLTKAGPKVLDFGLATVQTTHIAEALTQQNMAVDEAGAIMGTLQYMSPEQLEGKAVDSRTDIFAFGVVLYEMTTGQQAFEGESQVSLITAIIQNEPKPVSATAPMNPPILDRIVQRCLAKDPSDRWQNIADVREALQWVMDGAVPSNVAGSKRRWRAWIISTILAGGTLSIPLYFVRHKLPETGLVRFSFTAPGNLPFADLSVSPDGSRLMIAGTEQTTGRGLWLRSLDSVTMQELAVGASRVEQGSVTPPPYPERTTQSIYNPFWSPDGHFVAFLTPGKLNKIGLEGPSSVQTIWSHRPPGVRGGSWNAEGTIVIPNSLTGGLVRVSAAGGTPARVTALSPARQELAHRYPEFLPDGRHFLYWAWSASEEYTGIYLGSLDSDIKSEGEHPLLRTLRKAFYTSPGYLLFLEDSTLFAQRFDPGRLRLSGKPIQLPVHIATGRETGQAFFSVSDRVLAYQEASLIPEYRVLELDWRGKQLKTIETSLRSAGTLSLSPDEKHLALDGNSKADVEDIWIVDRERGISSRLTASLAANYSPVWAPDGHRVLFQSNRRGVYDLYIKDYDGLSREEELLLESEVGKVPTDWSRNGRFIVYHQWDRKTNFDLWLLPMAGNRKPFPFARTEFNESFGKFSPVPDSQGDLWMAYASDETGRNEIYLQRIVDVPGLARVTSDNEVRVSIEGGDFPSWRADGKELFYISPNGKLMAVDVRLGVPVAISAPRPLFALPNRTSAYAPLRDGRRFLISTVAAEPPPATINVVVNWAAELR